MAFPEPTITSSPRQPGNGCKVCVHRTYCPSMNRRATNGMGNLSDRDGVQCASWSTNRDDIWTEILQEDIDENARRSIDDNWDGEMLLREPNYIDGQE